MHMSAGNHDQQRPEALHSSRAGVTAGEPLDVVLEADLKSSGRTVYAFNQSHLSSTSI